MTTLTGVWGNVVVRNNELVPFNTDKFMDAINIDRGYSPLYEYFPDPIDEDHLIVAPSSWGMPRRRALARLCQQEGMVYPAWQIATEWVKIDAAECPPAYLLVIECTKLTVTFTLVRASTQECIFTDFNPGMGYAPVVEKHELDPQGQAIEWARLIASSARLILQDIHTSCDVVVLTGSSGIETDICELVCETLRAAGVMSYRISPNDMHVIYQEREWRASAEYQRDIVKAREAALRKKRFHKPTRAEVTVVSMIVIAMLTIVLAGVFGTEKRPEGETVRAAHHSVRTVESTQALTFPGGVLALPNSWMVSADSPSVVDLKTKEQWKTIIAPINEPDLRMLLTLKQDPEHHLRAVLRRELSDSSSEIRTWESTYTWPRNGWMPELALSYREITGDISRADWVVFYTDRYAYSLACQYRVREGMTESKAHALCQGILNGIRVS